MRTVPGAGSSPDGRPALRRCVAGDLDEFARTYWGARALLSNATELADAVPAGSPGQVDHEPVDTDVAAGPAPFDDLFSLAAADELLSRRGLRTPFLRIAKDGSVVGDNQFTGPGGVGAEIGDQVQDDKVAALFATGHTVVLQALHRTWPPLIDFATQLSTDVGHPVQINAYITPAESQGFAAHYDVHDVFVLQVAGEKHWTIHEPVHPDPLRNQPWTDHARAVADTARTKPPVIDAVLRPGDALYVPRGFLHSAKALGGVSAHLTVGLHTLTRYLLVQALATQAAHDPHLRTALPLGFDPTDAEQLAPVLSEVAASFAAQIQQTTPESLTPYLRNRTWPGNRPAPLPPLAHAAAINSLTIGTTVHLRPGLRLRLIPGDPVRLVLPDRTITLPEATNEALTRICTGDEVKTGDLPGLSDEDQLVLVRRLLTEAVLVVP